jgi:hypothetical protein
MTSVVTVALTMQLYVGLPVLVVGVLDRDTSIDNCLLFPALYLDGPRRQYINRRQFVYVEYGRGLVGLVGLVRVSGRGGFRGNRDSSTTAA